MHLLHGYISKISIINLHLTNFYIYPRGCLRPEFSSIYTEYPQKKSLLSGFEFLTLGWVFLGVKNSSKNFGNTKNIGLFSKILSKRNFFCSKSSYFFLILMTLSDSKVQNSFEKPNYLWVTSEYHKY